MKTSKLIKKSLDRILFEDHYNKYSSEYMSHPYEQETTIPPNLPVNAGEQMAVQLSGNKPPVEDDDFVPSNLNELGRAAQVLVQEVPVEQINFFYLELKRLIEDTINKNEKAERKVKVESKKRRS